jgi:hypothetical protein
MVKHSDLNSRMKDFFDIWLLARTGEFKGAELTRAIQRTFVRRGTALIAQPLCFTEQFASSSAKRAQWGAFIRRNNFTEVPSSFFDVVKSIEIFLHPVALALTEHQRLNAIWKAGGPWVSIE